MAVNRVESVTFKAKPETRFTGMNFTEEARIAASMWVKEVYEDGNYPYFHSAFHGEFKGLRERLGEKVGRVATGCDPEACRMDVSIDECSPEETDGETILSARCPLIVAETEEEAAAAEARCLKNHEATRGAFSRYVISTVVDVQSSRQRLIGAQAQVDTEQRILRELL